MTTAQLPPHTLGFPHVWRELCDIQSTPWAPGCLSAGPILQSVLTRVSVRGTRVGPKLEPYNTDGRLPTSTKERGT